MERRESSLGDNMILTAKTDLNTNRSEYTKDGESVIFADWISWKRAGDKFYPIGIETRQDVKKSTIETIYIYKDQINIKIIDANTGKEYQQGENLPENIKPILWEI